MIRQRAATLAGGFRVQRWTRVSMASALPSRCWSSRCSPSCRFSSAPTSTQQLTTLLIFVILAVMWNALAGYGGLISVGQQAFIGLGAYGTIFLTQHGFTPYLAMIVAGLGAGVVAVPDVADHAAPAWRTVRHRDVGGRRGVRHPRVARHEPRRRHRRVTRRTQRVRARIPPGVHVLADARVRDGAARTRLLPAPAPDRHVAAGGARRRGGGGFARCQRRAVQARPLRRRGGRVRHRRLAVPRQHAVHPDRLGVRRAVDRVHALHGAGRRTRHLRRSDSRRGHLLSDPGEVRQQRRVVLHRARSDGHRVRAVPAPRASGAPSTGGFGCGCSRSVTHYES